MTELAFNDGVATHAHQSDPTSSDLATVATLAQQVVAAVSNGADFAEAMGKLLAAFTTQEDILPAITTAARVLHGALGDRAIEFARVVQRPLVAGFMLTDCLLSIHTTTDVG